MRVFRFLLISFFILAGPVTTLQAAEIGTLGKYGIRHVTAPQAAELIETQKEIVILDVRTPGEFNEGHVAGAINIDYHGDNFAQLIGALDPDQHYLLYCRSGFRSGRTLPLMIRAGLSKISHLDGGINSWNAASLPLATQ
ncbi:rhodanese-like domain-containing protein [Sneathiella marina]|uniref:Rhodanese-like domain-containing protein n=1 Tax=Sneathiella marina TaxID=2950108 RepID=A0ABY4WD60_9PROT|nr:rhodanese-like domain-containing protein [Sneathiella marina]USG63199.1 rhodanese-like domain-containing protein [Sneathiella marina]